jgi:hypothetical protein
VVPGFERSLTGADAGCCYAPTSATVEADVLQMAYTSYGHWRDLVAQASCGMTTEALWGHLEVLDPDTVPFYELLNFSDCEGTVGPLAAAELASDFTDEARERFVRSLPEGMDPWSREHFLEAWDGWRRGVALAAQSGLIELR